LEAYDTLKPCYALLTNAIMTALPQSSDGTQLSARPEFKGKEVSQVIKLFQDVFKTLATPAGCPASLYDMVYV